ncbi:MAG: hypothetical protein K2J32_11125 [Ruminococcus sp.]|nr:hypothetical protein [Ruminococcus sp.]
MNIKKLAAVTFAIFAVISGVFSSYLTAYAYENTIELTPQEVQSLRSNLWNTVLVYNGDNEAYEMVSDLEVVSNIVVTNTIDGFVLISDDGKGNFWQEYDSSSVKTYMCLTKDIFENADFDELIKKANKSKSDKDFAVVYDKKNEKYHFDDSRDAKKKNESEYFETLYLSTKGIIENLNYLKNGERECVVLKLREDMGEDAVYDWCENRDRPSLGRIIGVSPKNIFENNIYIHNGKVLDNIIKVPQEINNIPYNSNCKIIIENGYVSIEVLEQESTTELMTAGFTSSETVVTSFEYNTESKTEYSTECISGNNTHSDNNNDKQNSGTEENNDKDKKSVDINLLIISLVISFFASGATWVMFNLLRSL